MQTQSVDEFDQSFSASWERSPEAPRVPPVFQPAELDPTYGLNENPAFLSLHGIV